MSGSIGKYPQEPRELFRCPLCQGVDSVLVNGLCRTCAKQTKNITGEMIKGSN